MWDVSPRTPPPVPTMQYTSRPFSVGDRVRLHSMEGELAVEGHVVALQPTRTVIQGERSVYYINNGWVERGGLSMILKMYWLGSL